MIFVYVHVDFQKKIHIYIYMYILYINTNVQKYEIWNGNIHQLGSRGVETNSKVCMNLNHQPKPASNHLLNVQITHKN